MALQLHPVHFTTDKWACGRCTFLNHQSLTYCEQCFFKITDNDVDIANQLQIEFEQQNNSFNQNQLDIDKRFLTDDNTKNVNNLNKSNFNNSINPQNDCYLQLLSMDIDPNIAFIASEIHPKSIDKALTYIQELQIIETVQDGTPIPVGTTDDNKANIDDFKDPITLTKDADNKTDNDLAIIPAGSSSKLVLTDYDIDGKQCESDRKLALKMQQELAQGMAWFCSNCFMMNMDIKVYKCEACDHERPKPKIPDVLTVRDDVCMTIIAILRGTEEFGIKCVINLALAENFVIKYLNLCKKRGLEAAKPEICYHWTSKTNFQSIQKKGLQVPNGWSIRHKTDAGFYGKGVYMSPDPKYAQSYGHGATKFFIALSLPGKMYSCPYKLGCSLQKGYDSHVAQVGKGVDPKSSKEWIFFDPAQLLLTHMVSLSEVDNVKRILEQVIQYLQSKVDELERNGTLNCLNKKINDKKQSSVFGTVSDWFSSWRT